MFLTGLLAKTPKCFCEVAPKTSGASREDETIVFQQLEGRARRK
jgi:hypothetical protein